MPSTDRGSEDYQKNDVEAKTMEQSWESIRTARRKN